MKKYIKPEVEIAVLNNEEQLMTNVSGGIVIGKFTNNVGYTKINF